MKKYTPEDLAAVPLYPHEKMTFIDELKSPLKWQFQKGCMIEGDVRFEQGIAFENSFSLPFPDTALSYVRKIIDAKNIPCKPEYSVKLKCDMSLTAFEEFLININANETVIASGSTEGMRRALYCFAELLRETEGATLCSASIHRKSWTKRRISRCFFSPTYRAPFFIDELNNDIDYYPENYLERLAADGINGLWMSIYFRDLPSDYFPGRGKDAPKRFEKLRKVVKRCADYGIKIYLYCSEPKSFGSSSFAIPHSDACEHPEVIGGHGLSKQSNYFCMSSDTAKKYLRDSAFQIFQAVPELGGLLNIIFGEDNGSCVHTLVYDRLRRHLCPNCKDRLAGEIFAESTNALYEGMIAASPDAELISWFYAPGIRDNNPLAQELKKAVDLFPDNSILMFNFESGGVSEQFGKGRNVFDYSLSYIGPSEVFRYSAQKAAKKGAKLQVCCSHEDASVPFIPVPSNLYRKYKVLHELNVETVLQCWYFGNYPGLMNRSAGALGACDFNISEEEFLMQIARADYGRYAAQAVRAWQLFSESYRNFPANIAFAWYGPLHNSIVWPLHLFPVDRPIAPSWILKQFPEVSGDRIGECLIFQHTLGEALKLVEKMHELWQKGLQEYLPLREIFKDVSDRVRDIDLAEAIGIQIESTLDLLRFYYLREDMLYCRNDRLQEMYDIVQNEISLSRRMSELCQNDPRLGYHSEAENYLFYPEKLDMRIKLLEQLEDDFKKFDINAKWIDFYTGTKIDSDSHSAQDESWHKLCGCETAYRLFQRHDNLVFELKGHLGNAATLEIEPCRMWVPMLLEVDPDGAAFMLGILHREEPAVKLADTDADGLLHAEIPLAIFDGFRRDAFPMRFAVKCGKNFQKSDVSEWPARLLHGTFNPENTTWLCGIK